MTDKTEVREAIEEALVLQSAEIKEKIKEFKFSVPQTKDMNKFIDDFKKELLEEIEK